VDRKFYILLLVGLAAASLWYWTNSMCEKKDLRIIKTVADIIALFPTTVSQLDHEVSCALKDAQERIKKIIDIPADERTFANTAQALDALGSTSNLVVVANVAHALMYMSPDTPLREAAQKKIIEIKKFITDNISNNVRLYQAFQAYVEGNAKKEQLTREQTYFLSETMKDYKRAGLNLPEEKLNEVRKLKNKLNELKLAFEQNIAKDDKKVFVTRAELAGLDDDFINALPKADDGMYILGLDYPTYFNVRENCTVESTRKKMFKAFGTRGYPKNKEILEKIIELPDTLSHLLGFESFAALDLDSEMAKKPERVEKFLSELLSKVQQKEAQEFEILTKELPESVVLHSDGKMYPWNAAFVQEYYKKKHYNIDENKIAEYFPMEPTIEGMLDIYQKFLGLTFKQLPISGLWHEDVKLIEITDNDTQKIIGYLLLDLYPRPNKFTHACHINAIEAITAPDGSETPALSFIIANFPKSTATKPSLLKRNDVETFFHEFGHAMHSLLGRTKLGSFAGTATKTDFVEVPSQMFEEWLWDKDILKDLSGHYKTGEQLPDELIDTLLKTKNLFQGTFLQRQLHLSNASLDYFKKGAKKDLDSLFKDLYTAIVLNMYYDDEVHPWASFGHLTDYGAKYYSYLWSKVFALDLFYEIKKQGLLNQEVGKRLIKTILGKGGSQEPDELLVEFLGREPNQKNFLKDLGLN